MKLNLTQTTYGHYLPVIETGLFTSAETSQVSILAVSRRLTFEPLTLVTIVSKVIEFFIRRTDRF